MEKSGIVIKNNDGIATVAVQRSGACGGGCKTCGGCSATSVFIELPNDVGAKAGDTVELVVNNSRVVKYTVLIYTVPLLLFILSLGLSYYYMASRGVKNVEIYSFLFGILGCSLSVFFLKFLDKRLGKSDSQMMKIGRIIK